VSDIDREWQFPSDEPPSQAQLDANTLARNPGVFIRETAGAEPMLLSPSLSRVLAYLPPGDPESTLEDALGRALAFVDEERARWTCSALGCQRIERELNGRAA
jgi:hypothetical protein